MRIYFLLLLAFSLNFTCCCDPNAIDHVFNDFTKSTVRLFEKGNYWVYENRRGDKIDSLYVVFKNEKRTKDAHCNTSIGIDGEIASRFLFETSQNKKFSAVSYVNDFNIEGGQKYIRIDSSLAYLDSLVVGQRTYRNVYGYQDFFYFAKDIGIIMFVSESDTFFLKHYNIQ